MKVRVYINTSHTEVHEADEATVLDGFLYIKRDTKTIAVYTPRSWDRYFYEEDSQ